MPDIWTHILCGNKSIAVIDNMEFYSEIIKRINIFKLGTQGPDIFYYYKYLSGFKSGKDKMLGKLMHTTSTGEFLINCLKYLKDETINQNYYNLLAYILGFISHYSLDSIAHPYIYYFALSRINKNSPNYLVNSYHKRLETIIDCIYINENPEPCLDGILPYKAIDVGVYIPESIADCLRIQIKNIYNVDIKNSVINNAYKDMKTGLKMLHDPIKIKFKTLKLLEEILGAPGKYSCAFYPVDGKYDFDYLNDSHIEWRSPYKIQVSCRDSFNDLFNLAVFEGGKRIIASIDFLRDEINEHELITFFPNISYLTGV